MFSQVIAGVDGTAGGHDAALLASKLVAPAGELTLVHVYPADESGYHGSGVNFTAIARQMCIRDRDRSSFRDGVELGR